ncbi:hypothetical protein [Natronobacterium gregoryi]|uniref:Uncharacterized protein n=2 Tax=Natronobacterium gregoryi TaxID=44930 RepID=L0AJ88_NATGS|nr:hypothetical protein [Natronobacterium gregoryi]AFZ73514.1 hypothetical protein Natgr_2342 [Natronobacterium gregoryi SP2]ELY68370.1 hypothetical protein C490_09858 [Natronobacterium gregoryi SP2]PLK20582.1 hypothetical protein CYV19_09070 [Natronobacterium gregoryi SP2]SFJ16328.1 hypothetical protein SAMN05443661_11617 [Natronobacterium gregoryi]
MPQSPCTRRGALQLGVGAFALLGGCIGTDPSEDDPEPDDEIDVIDGVDADTFRFDADDREVVVEREDDDIGSRSSRLPYVVEAEDVDALELQYEPVDDGEDEPADPLAALREIDYAEASAVVVQERVSACRRQAFQYAERRDPSDDESGVHVQFCTTKREPDVACSVDDQQVQVTVLELPIAYERRPSGHGRGRSSSCGLPPTIAEAVAGDRE